MSRPLDLCVLQYGSNTDSCRNRVIEGADGLYRYFPHCGRRTLQAKGAYEVRMLRTWLAAPPRVCSVSPT